MLLSSRKRVEYLKDNFKNWTSGNGRIDNFIQEVQLKTEYFGDDIVFEWIPYNQFYEIKETSKNLAITLYSVIWRDGPLDWNKQDNKYARVPNKKVALKRLHYSQNHINFVINEAKKYSVNRRGHKINEICGISKNPDTNDYILVLNNSINLVKWTSGNKRIDEFIQKMQLSTNKRDDIIFEWISYSQFNEIKKMGKNDFVTTYSAIWKNGPLYYSNQHNIYARDLNKKITLKYLHNSQNITDEVLNKNFLKFDKINELNKNDFMTVYSAIWKDGPLYKKNRLDNYYTRDSNKEVALKCSYNSQDSIELVINKAKKYLEKFNRKIFKPYGISQNPDTNDYILVLVSNIIWISGNKKIDDFIQKVQLKSNEYYLYEVFEWIPYYQLDKINEINKNDLMTVYSATWKDGPLYCDYDNYEYTRYSNKEVALKCLHNSHDSIELVINEAKKYLKEFNRKAFKPYGISQNPDTKDYILVLNDIIWISGNKKIDDFIQEMQSNIKEYGDIVFEWIPYCQLDKINEINKNDSTTVYSAIWKDGPMYQCTRDSNTKVTLKCLHSSQDPIELVINETKKYLKKFNRRAFKAYGISQNPDTKDYILVLNDIIWISGNKKIDDFIQEMQSNIKEDDDIVFEWIPYNQLDNISEINKNDFMTVYSAIWKDGPLYFNCNNLKYTRDSCKEVALKCLHNSQDLIEFVINEAEYYLLIRKVKPYGISKNPNTNDFILVLNLTSRNKLIDNSFILYIPYSEFYNIKKIGKGGFATIYLATWNDKKVALKCLDNLQNSNIELTNEARAYSTARSIDDSNILKIYGISQNPNTEEYVIVLHYANGGDFNNWISVNENFKYFSWEKKLGTLYFIACGLKKIHEKQMPFDDRAHDHLLALDICNGIRPKLNETGTPEGYIDLMKKCWNSNPENRPNVIELNLSLFCITINNLEIKKAENYRNLHLSSLMENRQTTTHPQAIYTSRLLNPFTKDLPKYDNNSECLDCAILD
ncbi:uncharacterized protein OCT59_008483 [Rhizophagus irregularis]|uniref:uncharacterized protein n=1 Tax=Rhizophagus irregularis TaxID=588596 RepID=UPI003328AF2F|nr:hypothetical protein OCT59_008483 [Rhizophagus irregularis]